MNINYNESDILGETIRLHIGLHVDCECSYIRILSKYLSIHTKF